MKGYQQKIEHMCIPKWVGTNQASRSEKHTFQEVQEFDVEHELR